MATQKPTTLPEDQSPNPSSPAGSGWRPLDRSVQQPIQSTTETADAGRPLNAPLSDSRVTQDGPTRDDDHQHPTFRFRGMVITLVVVAVPFLLSQLGGLGNLHIGLGEYLILAVVIVAYFIVDYARNRTVHGGIVGEVRSIHERSELKGTRALIIWSFRVESYDTNGNRLPPIPVEMRGQRFSGAISDGDVVEVPGRWRQGETVRARKIYNKTTRANVIAKG